MPGLDYFRTEPVVQVEPAPEPATPTDTEPTSPIISELPADTPRNPDVYYNPRLDPKNYLEGPLSYNPATRLRQMLARPGIVVSPCVILARTVKDSYTLILLDCPRYLRRY